MFVPVQFIQGVTVLSILVEHAINLLVIFLDVLKLMQ